MATRRTAAELRAAQTGELLRDQVQVRPAAKRVRSIRSVAKVRRPIVPAAGESTLDGGERLRIVDTLITALGQAYCHLPQKRAGYAADPIQALQLLHLRAATLSDGEFHLAVTSIVTALRDAHTQYSGPRSLQGAVASLPFLIEQYGPHDAPTFVVSKVSRRDLIRDKEFVEGAVLTSWNGVPFARAVDLHADHETGGRPDARRARALESMTLRALEFGPPPDEMWVIVGYRSRRGTEREVRIPWRIVRPKASPDAAAPGSHASRRIAVNPAAEQARRAKKLLFSGELWQAETAPRAIARAPGWIETPLQDVLAAREISTKALGRLGYLRMWSFDVEDHAAFVDELARLLDLLPDTGLILDLRGNPGGLIWAAERALQLFSPHAIVPTRFSLVATPLTRAMAQSAFNRLELEPWIPSLDASIATGEAYSQALPLTDPEWCNDVGQRYSGPVLCVADPNTYSSGDLFAAGFVDNQIGPLVCVGEATGAGGANVWTHFDLHEALADTPFALAALPDGVSYTIAIRRAVRAGAANGTVIEDVGIAGIPYAMTEADLLNGNRDLLEFCAGLLKGVERTAMKVSLSRSSVSVETLGLDELETYLDGRPLEAGRQIADGTIAFKRPRAGSMMFVGRRQGAVCQRRIQVFGQ